MTIRDSCSENMKLEKYRMLMTTTKIILGINDDTVNPYNLDIISC
tara:strand:- start:227 stop:361 length:135 start_codon:yes stop_codon:yes gene_type:complete